MDITLYSGDSRNLIINVTDENNSSINLTGASIEWILTSSNSTILSKSVGAGIAINNPTNGQFTISISSANTRNLSGIYQHLVRVTTTDGNSSIVLTGNITITKALL